MAFEASQAPSAVACANEELRARETELTALSRHLILIAEEEKAELARVLHDTFGSNLTAINMDLNWIAKRLPPDRPELRERLQRALRMLGETVAFKQEVIDRLRPSNLDTLGLGVAIQAHCRDFESRGISCDVAAPEDFEGLDPACSIALYRFAQDALGSIDAATDANVVVKLSREERGIRLRIHDTGTALAAVMRQSPPNERVIAMRERIDAVGGALTVTATATEGTILEAFIASR